MDINVTLFGEILTFFVLVWVTMKYIWPPLMKAIQERQQKIVSGLEAAERSKHKLEITRNNIVEQLRQTKDQATEILNKANQQANDYIMKGKTSAQAERVKASAQTKLDLKQEINNAQYMLQQQAVDLAIDAAEKILQQKIDDAAQKKLVDKLIAGI